MFPQRGWFPPGPRRGGAKPPLFLFVPRGAPREGGGTRRGGGMEGEQISPVFLEWSGVSQQERHEIRRGEGPETAGGTSRFTEVVLNVAPRRGGRPEQQRHRMPRVTAEPRWRGVVAGDGQHLRLEVEQRRQR